MDIPKRQFPIKSLIFLKSNCHAKMAPNTRSSSPWPLPCRPLVFTRASSVFIPAVPAHISRQHDAVYDKPHRLNGVPLEFDRNASAGLY
jgi:hypothetical protein